MATTLEHLKIATEQPTSGELWFSSVGIEVKKSKPAENVRTFIISTMDVDRDGDILEPKGLQFENYLKNPQVLWAHDYRSHPIGRAVRLEVGRRAIESDVEFAPTQFAQETKMLVDLGFLKASSVGFLPSEWKIRDVQTQSVQDDPDAGVTRRIPKGYHFTKWELLEWSIVPVPANPNALLAEAKSKGVPLPGLLEMMERYTITKPGIDETDSEFRYRLRDPGDFEPNSFRTIPLKRSKPRIAAVIGRLKGATTTTLQSLRFPKGDGWTKDGVKKWVDDHPDLGKTIDPFLASFEEAVEEEIISLTIEPAEKTERWTVGGDRTLSLVKGTAWDATAAVGRVRTWAGAPDSMDWGKYAKAFIVHDAADAEKYGAYKLPFADVKGGKLVAMERGLIAARSVLAGGRGGVALPDPIKAAAVKFVNAYLGAQQDDASWVWTTLEDGLDDAAATHAELVKVQAQTEELIGFKVLFEELATDKAETLAKIGAVLNAKNKKKLSDAMALIAEVLKSAEKPDGGDGTGDGTGASVHLTFADEAPADTTNQPPAEPQAISLNEEMVAAAFAAAVDRALAKLTGRVNGIP